MFQAVSPPAQLTYHVETESQNKALELSTIKEFLALDVDDTSRDVELDGILIAATKAVESYINMKLLTSTIRAEATDLSEIVRLESRPFKSIEKIDYVKSTGEVSMIAAETYHALGIGQFMGEVYLGDTQSWPTDKAHRGDVFRVHFTVGFGDAHADIPAEIKHALLMTIAALDAQRGDCECNNASTGQFQYYTGGSGFSGKAQGTVIPSAAEAFLRPYKLFSIGVI